MGVWVGVKRCWCRLSGWYYVYCSETRKISYFGGKSSWKRMWRINVELDINIKYFGDFKIVSGSKGKSLTDRLYISFSSFINSISIYMLLAFLFWKWIYSFFFCVPTCCLFLSAFIVSLLICYSKGYMKR